MFFLFFLFCFFVWGLPFFSSLGFAAFVFFRFRVCFGFWFGLLWFLGVFTLGFWGLGFWGFGLLGGHLVWFCSFFVFVGKKGDTLIDVNLGWFLVDIDKWCFYFLLLRYIS